MTNGRVLTEVNALPSVDDTSSIVGCARGLGSVHAAAGSQHEAQHRRGGSSTESNAAAFVGTVGNAGRAARALQHVQRLPLGAAGQGVHLLPTRGAVEVPVAGGPDRTRAAQRQNGKLHVATIGRDVARLQHEVLASPHRPRHVA